MYRHGLLDVYGCVCVRMRVCVPEGVRLIEVV